jgi:hypothetical protein
VNLNFTGLLLQDSPYRSQLLMQARLMRRSLRRLSQALRYRRLSLDGVPVFFANSFPKSGTHLLTQVLQGLARIGPAVDSGLAAVVTFEGESGRLRSEDEILGDLRRLLPGDIAFGHLHALPRVVDFLCQDGFAPYFILRDPRDVVVSHVYYVTEMETSHIHHRYYREELHTFEERLKASIVGRADEALHFPDIRARFQPYLGWLERSEVLVLRFEDFITQREETLGRILDHAVRRGFVPAVSREQALQTLSESIRPERSPTFRSGKAGGWKIHFNDEAKRLFKEVAGDLLLRLGYEQGYDW